MVPTDDDGRVVAFVEKPPRDEAPTNLINAGTYVLEPDVLDRISRDGRVSIERETFPALAAEGRLYAVGTDAYWLDTGTPDAYLRAHADLLAGTPARAARTRRRSGIRPSVAGPGASARCDVRSRAVVRSLLGARCAGGRRCRGRGSP